MSYAGVRLSKRLEEMRQKFRRDADARIRDNQLHFSTYLSQPHVNCASRLGELNRVRQEVHRDLFDALTVAPYFTSRINGCVQRDTLRLCDD